MSLLFYNNANKQGTVLECWTERNLSELEMQLK